MKKLKDAACILNIGSLSGSEIANLTPSVGQFLFNSDTKTLQFYDGDTWLAAVDAQNKPVVSDVAAIDTPVVDGANVDSPIVPLPPVKPPLNMHYLWAVKVIQSESWDVALKFLTEEQALACFSDEKFASYQKIMGPFILSE